MLVKKGLNISDLACKVLEHFSKKLNMPQQKIVDGLILYLPKWIESIKKATPGNPEYYYYHAIRETLADNMKLNLGLQRIYTKQPSLSELDKMIAERGYKR